MADPTDADMEGDALDLITRPDLRLLFVVDITTSMQNELEACKGAMRGMVDLLGDMGTQIGFAVITFTESDSAGCFTSLFESTSPEAA